MNKSKIEWCDYTWNPVTGCLHGCKYCYARRITERFKGGGYGKEIGMFVAKYKDGVFAPPYELNEPQLVKTKDGWYRNAPYPFGFEPTFHKYRLNDPQKIKKLSKIFVCSMADLFGEWVLDEWIEEVMMAITKAPQHEYLFLTKNPNRYDEYFEGPWQNIPEEYDWSKINMKFGTTITCQDDLNKLSERTLASLDFFSIEPILGSIDISEHTWCDYICSEWNLKWVIIGSQTGPGAVPPKAEWVQSIIDQCRDARVPVFLKNSLKSLMGDNFIQEWPEEMNTFNK